MAPNRILLATVLVGAPALYASQDSEIVRGTTALYQGNYREAAAISQSYVRHHPNSAEGHILLGQVLMASGDYDQAFSELRQALRIEPENLDALYFLGKVSVILGQIELEKLRKMAPDSARVHQVLGESYALQNAAAEAEREFLAALKANPRLVDVLNQLGDLKRKQVLCDEANAYYQRAAGLDPDNYDSAYGIGACYLLTDQPKLALEALRRAVSVDPASAPAWYALARALSADGQAAEAAAELEKAVALEPAMGEAHYLLGRIYRQLGREPEATEAFRKARELYRSEVESQERRR